MDYALKGAATAAGISPGYGTALAALPWIAHAGKKLWDYSNSKKSKGYARMPMLRRGGKSRRPRNPKFRRRKGIKRKRYGRGSRGGNGLYKKIQISKSLTAPYTVQGSDTLFRESQTGKKAIFTLDYDGNDMCGVADDKCMTLFAQGFRSGIQQLVAPNQKMAITQYRVNYNFRNLSKNRIFLTIYTCKVRHDYCRDNLNYLKQQASNLNDFLASQLLQSDSPEAGTLNKIDYNTKLLDIPTVGQVIHVLKAKKYSLDAGQAMSINWKKKDHYFSNYVYNYDGTLVQDRFMAIELSGDIIHETDPLNLAGYKKIAPSCAKLAITAVYGASVWRVGESQSLKISYNGISIPSTAPGAVDINNPSVTVQDTVVST